MVPRRPGPRSLTILRGAEVYAPEPLGRRDLVIGGGTLLAITDDAPAIPGAEVVELGGTGESERPCSAGSRVATIG